jgi:hypothetical protein
VEILKDINACAAYGSDKEEATTLGYHSRDSEDESCGEMYNKGTRKDVGTADPIRVTLRSYILADST